MGTRFGLVGTGYWARETHGPALLAHPDVELAGVWGRSPERADELAGDLACSSYPTLDALLDDVDAVAVAVPPDIQAEVAVRAAEHGCHLLLDKPLALDVAAADRVVDAVEAAGVRSIVFFTLRFTPSTSAWLVELSQKGVGRNGRVRLHASIFEPGNPYGASPWRQERGALWDIGPHALSMLIPALGPVEQVHALRGRGDDVEVILRHASGAVGSMGLSLTAPPGDRSADWTVYGDDHSSTMPAPDEPPPVAYGRCLSELLANREQPWSHACDVRFGRDVVAVLARAEAELNQSAQPPSRPSSSLES